MGRTGPVYLNFFLTVELLLLLEDVFIELKLELFVDIIDAQLLEAVFQEVCGRCMYGEKERGSRQIQIGHDKKKR